MQSTQERFPEAAFAAPGEHAPAGDGNRQPEAIKREIEALIQKKALPKDFRIEEAVKDQEFIGLLMEMPAAYAVRVYAAQKHAENAEREAIAALTTRLRAREGLPQSARANMAALPARDYANMSAEEFQALERKFKEQAQKGIRAKL